MTENSPFEKSARARIAEAGEKYTEARRAVSKPQTEGVSSLSRLLRLIKAAIDAQVTFLEHCEVVYDDINADKSSVIVIGWFPWRWKPLASEAQAPLGAARKVTEAALNAVKSAVEASEHSRLPRLEKASGPLRAVLAQDDGWGGAPGKSIEAILEKVRRAGVDISAVLEELPSAHGPGGRILVADTNALLARPDLTTWTVGARSTLVIVPAVTRELDKMKTRDKSVGDKARKVIRQLNEFDRRGNTLEGVRLAGHLWLREVAISPEWGRLPQWLDRGLADDEILACALEYALRDLRAEVFVVTRDRNMKNRARLAGLSSIDTDDLAPA